MSTRWVRVWVVLLAGMAGAASLSMAQDAGPDSAGANDLRALERGKFAAIERHDKGALDGMLDDALIGVDVDGSVRGKVDYLANQDPRLQLRQMAVASMSVEVFGDVAVVVGIYEEKGLKSGRPYRQRCRFIDTWEWKKGKWVCIGMTVTPEVG
jgi:ketosteroid isomerase-like protein